MKVGDLVRFKRYKNAPTGLALIIAKEYAGQVIVIFNGEIRSISTNRLFSKAVNESR
jgi:hypothetical protein